MANIILLTSEDTKTPDIVVQDPKEDYACMDVLTYKGKWYMVDDSSVGVSTYFECQVGQVQAEDVVEEFD